MKYLSALILIIFGIVIGSALLSVADHATTYDTDTPLGSEDPKLTDDYFRDTKTALQERLDQDHLWYLDGSNTADGDDIGLHRKVTMPNPDHAEFTAPTTGTADYGIVYVDDAADDDSNDWAELHYMDEQDNAVQLTKDGAINAGAITQGDITQADNDTTASTSFSYDAAIETWTELETVTMTISEGSDVLVMFHATAISEGSGRVRFRIQHGTTDLACGVIRGSGDGGTIHLQALHENVSAGEYTYAADYYRLGGTWTHSIDHTRELTVVELKK